MKKFIAKDLTYRALKPLEVDVAILPWGATEPHGYHLPFGTDIYEAEGFATKAAEIAVEAGVTPLVLPAIPFGMQNEGQRNIPSCINLKPSTQLLVLEDIIVSLLEQGIKKLIILNGHGGNDFRCAVREMQMKHPAMLIVAVDWWKHPAIPTLVADPGDHAGGLETSVMMHLHPELVAPLEIAGDGGTTTYKIDGLNEGWAWTPRSWSKVSKDTGIGNPKAATPEQGKAVFETVSVAIADLIVGLTREENIYHRF